MLIEIRANLNSFGTLLVGDTIVINSMLIKSQIYSFGLLISPKTWTCDHNHSGHLPN